MKNVISTVLGKIRKNNLPQQPGQKIDTNAQLQKLHEIESSGRLVPWDWYQSHQLSRSRYMEVRSLLKNPLGPSIKITTEELANVVNGREDIPLPEWANNQAFEAELESLIEHSSTVWVCPECDSIVSFFSVANPGLLPDLIKDLLAVWEREKIPCPYCGAITILLVDSKALTKGEKIKLSSDASLSSSHKPPQMDELATEGSATDSKEKSTPTTSRNEKYLDEILHKEYGVPPNRRTDVLELSDYTSQSGTENFFETVQSWPEEDGLFPFPRNIPQESREPILTSISLRPRYGGAGSNVLGRIWDSVKLMVCEEYPVFSEVAIGQAVGYSLSASAHLGDSNEMAIVLGFGLFDKLYKLNHLLNLLYDDKKQGSWSVTDIAFNLISELTGRQVDPTKARNIPNSDYRTQSQFWAAHIISNAQQQFAILHELGHLADWTTSPRLNHHEIKDLLQRTRVMEMWADNWALDFIIRKGDDFYIPWLQYRSIFWLFEYWHVMATAFNKKNSIYQSSRRRWDEMEALLRREGADVSRLDTQNLRDFIDFMVIEMEK